MRNNYQKGIAVSFVAFIVLTLALALCIGCSPRTASEGSGQVEGEQASVVEFAWSADSNCETCHTTQMPGAEPAATMAQIHSDEGLTCVQCHSDSDEMSIAHEGATIADAAGVKKLKKTTIDEALCFTCHSRESLIASTADSTVLADPEGTVVNPHNVPQTEQHEEKKVSCGSCHQMHGEDANAGETAFEFCGSCHHKDIYRSCDSCHGV